MPNTLKSGYTWATMLCVFALSFCITNSLVSSSAFTSRKATQKKEKALEKGAAHPNQPVSIIVAKQGEKVVRFNEGFEGDSDWLKGMGFKLKNVSNREISFVEVDINLPETKTSGPEMSFSVSLGHHPNRNNTSREPLSLPPGGEIDVVLDEKEFKNLTRLVESRESVNNINKAVVRVGFVIFTDGLAYSGSYYRRRDPDNPKLWLPIANEKGEPIVP